MTMFNNKRKHIVFLMLIVGKVIAETQGQACLKRVHVEYNKKLNGRTYLTHNGINRRQCGTKCIISGSCQAVNFRKKTGICQFLGTADKPSLNSTEGWEYIEKGDFTKAYGNPCGSHACPLRHSCVKLSSGTPHCIITECSTWPVISNSKAGKNRRILFVPVGTSIQYTCIDGYELSPGSDGKLTCLASGNYTEADFSCIKTIPKTV